MQWHDQDKIIPHEEAQIAKNWGRNRIMMDGLRRWDKICQPSSPNLWSAPPSEVFKLNFSGASRGNLGSTPFGGLCRYHDGRIVKVFVGSIGVDTNNSVELEGIICGLKVLIMGGHFPAIIEGESNMLIEIAERMVNGQMSEKSFSQLASFQ